LKLNVCLDWLSSDTMFINSEKMDKIILDKFLDGERPFLTRGWGGVGSGWGWGWGFQTVVSHYNEKSFISPVP
jgi:hypothetical protein